jgi:hypothetical protein
MLANEVLSLVGLLVYGFVCILLGWNSRKAYEKVATWFEKLKSVRLW